MAAQLGIGTVFVQHRCHDFGENSLPGQCEPMRAFVAGETLTEEDPARIERTFEAARQEAAARGIDLRLP